MTKNGGLSCHEPAHLQLFRIHGHEVHLQVSRRSERPPLPKLTTRGDLREWCCHSGFDGFAGHSEDFLGTAVSTAGLWSVAHLQAPVATEGRPIAQDGERHCPALLFEGFLQARAGLREVRQGGVIVATLTAALYVLANSLSCSTPGLSTHRIGSRGRCLLGPALWLRAVGRTRCVDHELWL